MTKIWKNSMGWRHRERLSREAGTLAARAVPPQSAPAWETRREALRRQLNARFGLGADATPIDLRIHRSIPRAGYRIDLVTYASGSPDIRVTAALYVPDGPGPFPAVLNLHGHWGQGKLAGRVQLRGHLLAQHGFVVLSPDAPGAGERSHGEGDFRYHGGLAGAGLYLIGDSLLAWQIRDNRRALDVLESLPVVDNRHIGVTGASGGGNQTMWISACDERVAASVPVVSVGTFEVYVTKRNCICETLPAGLTCMEEWELLGLMAPRPLLLLNAYQDAPSFGPEAVTRTAQALRELYGLWAADERFDARLFNTPHGYWPEMLAAMLGWMQYWLKGEGPGFARALPEIVPEAEADMRCFAPGSWPAATQAYAANKETLLAAAIGSRPVSRQSPEVRRDALAACVGYRDVREVPAVDEGPWREGRLFATAVLPSPRGIPLPLVRREADADDAGSPVDLIVGASGKDDVFAAGAFAGASTAVALDLPGVGELAWEGPGAVGGARLHDTARACLWLGYTLAGEWAECVTALVRWARLRYPGRPLRLIADEEAALAVLLAAALDSDVRACERKLTGLPESFRVCYRAETGSMAMMLPGILKWGDLSDIHHLATG